MEEEEEEKFLFFFIFAICDLLPFILSSSSSFSLPMMAKSSVVVQLSSATATCLVCLPKQYVFVQCTQACKSAIGRRLPEAKEKEREEKFIHKDEKGCGGQIPNICVLSDAAIADVGARNTSQYSHTNTHTHTFFLSTRREKKSITFLITRSCLS